MITVEASSATILNLPRLLYIGDVAVESTTGGSALLYRLLQNYPSDRLCIVEGNITKSQADQRLPKVAYETISVGSNRLLHSRFVLPYRSCLYLSARWRSRQLSKLIETFQPDAILTVAHGFSWLTAAELGAQHKLPLHFIVHDDWPSHTVVMHQLRNLADKDFGTVYRQARSRLCVSPYMMESYQKQYGVTGNVLYPSRAVDVPEFSQPAEKTGRNSTSLVFAYAGSIHIKGYAESLVSLASILEAAGHRLVIYSGLTQSSIQHLGLDKPNVVVYPMVPSQQLIHTLRKDADVLFVPMDFDQEYRSNMEISFPSKLTDYTAIGLPLLIWGPSYCSAIRWAQDNPGVAEIVEKNEISALADSVKKLSENPKYRLQLATNALTKGVEYFSHAKVIEQFYQVITQLS
ncbi:hypothetical protein BV372_22525 [Nostoc sp. T09]|uniref:glycosyltransferase n=1 Tax=Nostoc sp. T09 TaxID=1932621 RepID=UPI000A39274D|nr:glycosyltransferase [Nostoc sp. T09]OUL29873.1 hypothetical protein BV372_22525 [Nostoc sp. T09]